MLLVPHNYLKQSINMSAAINVNESNTSVLDNLTSSFPPMFNSLVTKHPMLAFIALLAFLVSATLVCMIPLFGYFSRQKTKRLANLRAFRLKEQEMKLKANEQKLRLLKIKEVKDK